MEDDLPTETMSVELAIQRELAYRTKLASELGPTHNSLKNLIPLQAQSSIPSPIGTICVSVPQPLPPVVQSSIRYPIRNSPSSSLLKRKEPSTSISEHRPLVVKPTSRNPFPNGAIEINKMIVTNNLRCKLCGVDCLSQFNLEQHMNGQKHRAKLQEFGRGQRRWCQVCGIACSDENALQMHLQGKKHKSKALESDHPRFSCQVCQIWCIDESSYGQHLDGKKHNAQIRLSK